MLSEGRKRDAAANAVLGLAFAANAAQSPKDLVKSGSIEAPGVIQMQRTIGNPRRKPKDLDRSSVLMRGSKLKEGKDVINKNKSHKKMKTFREFLEEAYLVEMRKEDEVKGETKTPLYITSTSGRVVKKPEGGLEVKKTTRTALSPRAATGRMKQGMIDPKTQPYATRMPGAARHAHGGGGSGAEKAGRLRGVGKLEKQKMDKEKRDRGERPLGSGQSPAQKVELRKAQRRRSTGGGY